MASFLDNDSPTNLTEYTVSELSGSIKRTLENNFDQVRLRGEISGYRGPHTSGHAYFSLKDDRARIEAVIWKTTFSRLKFHPEEGMEVIATGKITTFPGSSKYQIVIEQMEPAGAGALMALIEERKRKLGAEGLFDPGRKQLLPHMPAVIGVITSPTGAVIRDILHRIADRFPLHVLVWPVKVQGDGSGIEIANAITGFNAFPIGGAIARPDVLIVARGGGSLEDLWSFNDEIVVRAAAASDIPLISAVGHETDWTLIDFASDQRAPTPTGAAEMAVPVKAELEAALSALSARLKGAQLRQMEQRRAALRSLARALPSLDGLLAMPRRHFDEVSSGLVRGLVLNTTNKRIHYDRAAARLRPDILAGRLAERRQRLGETMLRAERIVERMLDRHGARISRADAIFQHLPSRLFSEIARLNDRLANLIRRSEAAMTGQVNTGRSVLAAHDRMLQSLSYRNVLSRGFTIVRDIDNNPVTKADDLAVGQTMQVEFADGKVDAITIGNTENAPKKRPQKPLPAGKTDQGSLF